MNSPLHFQAVARIPGKLGRAGILKTPHGDINTPAFVTVGTQATIKAVTPEQVQETGSQVVLANTYHLYLQPGHKTVEKLGGLHKFMNWNGPLMTDSGGFQAFSLGAAFGKRVSKFGSESSATDPQKSKTALAQVDDDGVTFKSHRDGSSHRFTPEISIDIQHSLGADIIVAFDECTSPEAGKEYQALALERTRRWAERCVARHHDNTQKALVQGLYGVIQGGRHEDLRALGAKQIADLPFDGFAIGGSFTKEDLDLPVIAATQGLPQDKPRHLLGIGEPKDLVIGIANGCDTFDCVIPTRAGRTGTLYTWKGRVNILNAKYRESALAPEPGCACYTCTHYSQAYLNHLSHAHEMMAATLISIHNIYFMNTLVEKLRIAILENTFHEMSDLIVQTYS